MSWNINVLFGISVGQEKCIRETCIWETCIRDKDMDPKQIFFLLMLISKNAFSVKTWWLFRKVNVRILNNFIHSKTKYLMQLPTDVENARTNLYIQKLKYNIKIIVFYVVCSGVLMTYSLYFFVSFSDSNPFFSFFRFFLRNRWPVESTPKSLN